MKFLMHSYCFLYVYLRLFWTLFDPRLFYLVPPNIIEMKLRYSFSTIRITYMWHNNWSSIFNQTCNPDVYKLYSAQKIEKILCKNKMYEHWKWIGFSETALFLKLFQAFLKHNTGPKQNNSCSCFLFPNQLFLEHILFRTSPF